jgi:hypothetical protein
MYRLLTIGMLAICTCVVSSAKPHHVKSHASHAKRHHASKHKTPVTVRETRDPQAA